MVVEAKVGATAILNCTFHPPAKDLILYWTRLDSAGGISSVYIHYQGKVDTRFTDPTYVTRSSLVGDLDKGDASLRLGPLSPADRGTYCCRVKHAHGTDVAETQLHVLSRLWGGVGASSGGAPSPRCQVPSGSLAKGGCGSPSPDQAPIWPRSTVPMSHSAPPRLIQAGHPLDSPGGPLRPHGHDRPT